MAAPVLEKPLYLITDGGRLRASGILVRRIADALAAARGLIGYVQLRELGDAALGIPAASDAELIDLATRLKPILADSGAKLLLNSALTLVADGVGNGVHLGGELNGIRNAAALNRSLPPDKRFLIGYSAHSQDEALAAESAGADYVLLAPIFAPLSKIHHRPPLGLAKLKSAAAASNIPLFALGGITPQSAPHCRAAGASGIAAISSLLTPESADALANAWHTAPAS